MNTHDFSLPVDGAVLKGTAWLPEHPTATVLIEHGMAEHHKRYADFAAWLVERGIAVYAYDKRGHGLTAGPHGSEQWQQNCGWFAKANGWKAVVGDCLAMLDYVRSGGVTGAGPGRAKAGPGGSAGIFDPSGQGHLPLFLMGHSMGSFVVRDIAADPRIGRIKLAGLIVSSTAGSPGAAGALGLALANLLTSLRGATKPSPLLENLVSGKNNKMALGEQSPRTPFDWLSRDAAQVDKYVADPYCGNVLATSFYRDMLHGLIGLSSASYAKRFSRELPVLMFAGDKDPVGDLGRGVTAVHDAYKAWGVRDLTLKLYPEGRHELLNEINRLEVFQLVSDWIITRVPKN